MSLACRKAQTILQDRAALLKKVRTFFEERNVLEVDTPLLSKWAPIDAHIDILETEVLPGQKGYLHSSPEYAMKKLLAKDVGDIFQLSHVFRQGELSSRHQIEFSMIEWYRKDFSFLDLLHETKSLIFLFLGELDYELIRYQDHLKNVHGIDPTILSIEDLATFCSSLGLYSHSEDKDFYLNFLWDIAETKLGLDKLAFVTHFPASQAALSKTFIDNSTSYAGRFECYYQGIELANGYHELTDPKEQEKRLVIQNEKKIALGKSPLPIDPYFLKALEKLSHHEYYGVAVGFDRLMMARHHTKSIEDILPLAWEEQ